MGGHNAGEVASAIAIEVIERELGAASVPAPAPSPGTDDATVELASLDAAASDADAVEDADPNAITSPGMRVTLGMLADPSAALRTAVERANRAIWDEAQADPSRSGMGTTVVGAIFAGSRAYLANVGDSPAVLVRDGTSHQVTRDHGWVAEQVEAGLIDPQDAPYHPYRNILTRCLGTERSVAVEVYEPLDLLPGDQLVLCSDGVTTHVSVEEIAAVVARATPTTAARLLISLANERGGQDNITVVVARVVGA
jgi:serine/threonine protein phosphatase PrpC